MSKNAKQPVTVISEAPFEEWEDPVPNPAFKDAPVIPGLLPAITDDPHRNIVSRAMQTAGIKMELDPWVQGFVPLDEPLTVFVDERRVLTLYYDSGVALPNPVVVDLGVRSELVSHGVKDIRVHVSNSSGNEFNYNIIRVYVDRRDPNLNEQPQPITFEDYGPVLTPAFLNGKLGLTFTIPIPADRRGGDTYSVRVGTSTTPLTDAVPPTGDIEGVIPTAMILESEGQILVTYSLTDRAGNTTVQSIQAFVQVSLLNAPVFGPITVVEAPLVDKAEARNRATVRLQSLTEHSPSDVLVATWEGVEIHRQPIGSPTFPLDIRAGFAAIAAGGNDYTANIQLLLERGGTTYPAPPVTVDVDLREPGVTNPGEGPEDPAIAPPVLKGGGPSGADNVITEDDRGFAAPVTFLLPTGLILGVFIDYIFDGNVIGTYNVTGSEAPGFPVPFTVPWADIELAKTANVESYCVIRNAVNFKHSRTQIVVIDLFSLVGLELPIFEKATVIAPGRPYSYLINCPVQPWLGVPIKVLDPAVVEIDDIVFIEAIQYAFTAVGDPVGPVVGVPVQSPDYTLNSGHVNEGLTVQMDLEAWFKDYTTNRGAGYIGVRWNLLRPSTGARGQSDEVIAIFDMRSPGTPPTCVPGATRRSGTL